MAAIRLLMLAPMLLCAQLAQAQTTYQVIDLVAQCPAGSTDVVAQAINNPGDVVGTAAVSDGQGGQVRQYFVWHNGSASIIPSIGTVEGLNGGPGFGITDSGLVAGCSIDGNQWQCFIVNQGAVTGLPDLTFMQFKPCGGSDAVVGTTTGQIQYSDANNNPSSAPTTRVGLWFNGVITDLGPTDPNAFGVQAAAASISDSGQYICGWGGTLWDDISIHPQALLMTRDGNATALGGLSLPWGWATDVNNAGHAVGAAYVDQNTYHAALWRNGATDLAPSGWQWSMSLAINNTDQVVGYGWDANGRSIPFLWNAGTLVDLNTLVDANGVAGPVTLDVAYDINDAGQIVASGIGPAGRQPYLLNPVAPPIPGDFNGDGIVNGRDFLIWQQHYPMLSGATRADGDANGDGIVNGKDFLIWQQNYKPLK
jgi:probable HAF family extracellular repeat protein